MSAVPYTIDVPTSSIRRLKEKLELTDLPSTITGTGWDLGPPLEDIKRLAAYWKNGFDWKKQEAKLNELPNFRSKIDVEGFGVLDVHFVHQKSELETAIPLLFVHGWPGNFSEVTKILSLLAGRNGKPSFHVVAPSLPNFGFSSGIEKKGFRLPQYAETCHKLMQSLGYDQYVTQGGDWGTYITRILGLLYPQHCLASHINLVRGLQPKWTKNPLLALQHALAPYTEAEKRGLARSSWFVNDGSGYRVEQGTRPNTIGYFFRDSPVGLLAWIYEKLHDWTDDYPWTDDEILTWVSIYWFSTAGPEASARIYYEATHGPVETSRDGTSFYIPKVKLGLGYFPKEISLVPKTWGRTMGDVVYEGVHERGGHFAAWEQPQAIAGDLINMFKKGGACYGIVPGKDGYQSRTKL